MISRGILQHSPKPWMVDVSSSPTLFVDNVRVSFLRRDDDIDTQNQMIKMHIESVGSIYNILAIKSYEKQ